MKSKMPKRNNNDFYSPDEGIGRGGAAIGKTKRDRKPSIYDGGDDDDYDYRKDLMDEEDLESSWDDEEFDEEEEWDDDEYSDEDEEEYN